MIQIDMDNYQREAGLTLQPSADKVYLASKLCCESAEVLEPLLKELYHGKIVDHDNLISELGNVLWYLAVLSNALGIDLSAVAAHNIRKLRSRHGVAYNPKFYLEDK